MQRGPYSEGTTPVAVKAKRKATEYSRSVTTVRLTYEVKDDIVDQGRYDESIDEILRRVLPKKDLAGWILSQAKKDEERTIDQILRRLLRVNSHKLGAAK